MFFRKLKKKNQNKKSKRTHNRNDSNHNFDKELDDIEFFEMMEDE